jgi:hypothetical protein
LIEFHDRSELYLDLPLSTTRGNLQGMTAGIVVLAILAICFLAPIYGVDSRRPSGRREL